MKNSFILYTDFNKQISMLSDSQAGLLMKALFQYATTHQAVSIEDGIVEMLFSVMTAQIDRDYERYRKRCERNKEIAILREEKKRSPSPQHDSSQSCTFSTDNDNDTENDNENENDTESDTENENDAALQQGDATLAPCEAKKKKSPKAVHVGLPSVEDVAAYCRQIGSSIDPKHFWDYYAAMGWMIGGCPIRDWRAKLREWERTEGGRMSPKGRGKPARHPEDACCSFDLADLDLLVNRF